MERRTMKIGDTIYHHVFGKGTIVGIGKVLYRVQFDGFSHPRVISKSYFSRNEERERDE